MRHRVILANPAQDEWAIPIEAWAEQVQEFANELPPEGRYGDERAFIGAVWKSAARRPRVAGETLEAFKSRLVEANRRGLLRLHRADLVGAMDPKLVAASETRHLNATFHFIEIRGVTTMAKKKASKKQTTEKATKKKASKKRGKKSGKKRAKKTGMRQAGVEKMLAANEKKATKKKASKGRKKAAGGLYKAAKEPVSAVGKAVSRAVGSSKVLKQKLSKRIAELEKQAKAAAKNADLAAIRRAKAEANMAKQAVRTHAKDGDLSREEEQKLLRKLAACQKRCDSCEKQVTEGGGKKKGKKKGSSKKKGKKKGSKKKAAKKGSKKKAAKKASSGSMPYEDYRRNMRVPAGVVGSRKKAAERKKTCNTKRKKKPVGCQPRPSESSLAACTRATASWADRSDEPRTARQVCGPGAPSLKKAAAIGGMEKAAKAKGNLSPRQADIVRRLRNISR